MGQYYNPVILKKNWKQAKNPVEASLKCYDYNNGAKLMEHSYVGNGFVNAVEDLLANDYKGYPFVWIGDYADEVTTNTGEHNIYNDANSFIYKDRNCSENTKKYEKLRASIPDEIHHYKYLINYTKKEYCIIPKRKENVWQVHPLPLLTCNGNSLGGGDYMLSNDEYNYQEDGRIGSWAFNRIGVTNDKREIVGMNQIDGYFPLDW